jgi:hypothetical protein
METGCCAEYENFGGRDIVLVFNRKTYASAAQKITELNRQSIHARRADRRRNKFGDKT